jgi:hypothetical protein
MPYGSSGSLGTESAAKYVGGSSGRGGPADSTEFNKTRKLSLTESEYIDKMREMQGFGFGIL